MSRCHTPSFPAPVELECLENLGCWRISDSSPGAAMEESAGPLREGSRGNGWGISAPGPSLTRPARPPLGFCIWSMQALTEAGDSELVEYEMVATSSMEGWTITFPDRDPVPGHIVEASGDSVVIHVGPYASALRENVQVSTLTVTRIVDGKMMGYFTPTYQMEGGEEILKGLQQGERMH